MAEFQRTNKKLRLTSHLSRHDIRNEFFIISRCIELVMGASIDACMKSHLSRMQIACKNIEKILNSTRDYERLGSAELQWQHASYLFAYALEAFDATGIKFDLRLDGLMLCVDPIFEEVFYNLIDTSISHG
ncbi:MAG: hypothetical protein QXN93_06960 [Methanomassiliicoccales archaeon]